MLRFYKWSQIPRLLIFKNHIHWIRYMICVPFNIWKVSVPYGHHSNSTYLMFIGTLRLRLRKWLAPAQPTLGFLEWSQGMWTQRRVYGRLCPWLPLSTGGHVIYAHQHSSQMIAFLSFKGKETKGEKWFAQDVHRLPTGSRLLGFSPRLQGFKFGNSEKVSSSPYVLVPNHVKQSILLS